MSKKKKQNKQRPIDIAKAQFTDSKKPVQHIVDKKSYDFANSKYFLKSFDWLTLRMKVLKKYGATCQCCGSSAHNGAVINVDHIKPRSKFPELCLDENNLQVLCNDCNKGKAAWDQTDWRPSEDFTYDPATQFNEMFK